MACRFCRPPTPASPRCRGLVASAKSVATQALQTTIGYSSKSSFSVALGAGASAANLFGGTSFTAATLTGVTAKTTAAADIASTTSLTTAAASNAITATINNNDTLTVDGHTITFKTGAATPTAASLVGTTVPPSGVSGNVVTDGSGNSTVYTQSGTVADLLNAIDLATGVQTATISTSGPTAGQATLATAAGATVAAVNGSGQLVISTGTAADLSIFSNNANLLGALGIGNGLATTSLARTPSSTSNLAVGTNLQIAAVGTTGTATNITFGTNAGQVHDLNGLNAALAANNLQATLDANGNLTIQTNNDNASQQILGIVGTPGSIFANKNAPAPVADPNAQATRAGLVGAVQQHPVADHHDRAGLLVQRCQPVERRHAQADLRRDQQINADHHRYDFRRAGSWPCQSDGRHRLHRQRGNQQGVGRR